MVYERGRRFMPEGRGICDKCKHVFEDGNSCKAFPKEIPLSILIGEFDHRKPYEGDKGIQFEATA